MACNCIEQSEQEVLNHLRAQHPDRTYADIQHFGELGYQNTAFSFSQSGTFFSYPFKTRHTFLRKNGQLSAPVNKITNMTGAYCPFCGVKYKEDQPINEKE